MYSKKQFIKTKMVHAAIHVKNNMIPELEVTSCIKDREKNVLDSVLL